MKNKKLTPYLLVVVLIVWGAIMYRVYKTVNSNNTTPNFKVATSNVELHSIDPVESNYTLILSYSDPFLKNVEKKKVVKRRSTVPKPTVRPKKNPVIKEKKEEKNPIRWDEIKYSGSFLNKKSGDNVALISFFNIPLTIKEGEEKNGLLVKKIYGDSLRVRFSGEDKTIIR